MPRRDKDLEGMKFKGSRGMMEKPMKRLDDKDRVLSVEDDIWEPQVLGANGGLKEKPKRMPSAWDNKKFGSLKGSK